MSQYREAMYDMSGLGKLRDPRGRRWVRQGQTGMDREGAVIHTATSQENDETK